MGVLIEVDYFNSFWMKKVIKKDETTPDWPGLPWNPTGYPTYPFGLPDGAAGEFAAPADATSWYIEEMRIKCGYNNTPLDLGVKAYIA